MTDENGNVVVDGCVRRGIPEDVAGHIYDEMSAFASYAFNKSHAAAYAMVAVQTGWLKLHYPVPFMAALMNSMLDNTPKIAGYIQYCRQNGIPILPPDVNKSIWPFSADRDENGKPGIRFGLGGVKNVGHGAVRLIEKERAKGPFTNIFDFTERCCSETLNKRAVESLIKAGAFDRMEHNRNQLLQVYEAVMDDAANKRRNNVAGQLSLFDMAFSPERETVHMYRVPDVPAHNLKTRLSMEREMTGVYITGHPLDEVADLLRLGFTTVSDVQSLYETEDHGQEYDGMQASMAGILTHCKGKITKKGAMMGFFTLEDLTGQIEGLVFPKVYERYAPFLSVDAMVIVDGKLSFREEEEPKLLVDSVRVLSAENAGVRVRSPKEPMEMREKARAERQLAAANAEQQKKTDAQLAKEAPHKVYLLIPNRREMETVKELCEWYPGDVPVYVKLADEGIALLLSREYWCNGQENVLEEFRAQFETQNVVMR